MSLAAGSLGSLLTKERIYAPKTITAIAQTGDAQVALCLKGELVVRVFNVKMMEEVGTVKVDYMDSNTVALDCPKLEKQQTFTPYLLLKEQSSVLLIDLQSF